MSCRVSRALSNDYYWVHIGTLMKSIANTFRQGHLMKQFTLSMTLFLVLILGCSSHQNSTETEERLLHSPLPEKGVNVLFIGNSLTYSNNLPLMLERMLLLANIEVGLFEWQTLANYGLPDHWVRAETRSHMNRKGWDLVIMQQGPSATEGRPYLLDYAPRFSEEIRKSGAMPAMYMVWPARVRSFDFPGVFDSYRQAAINIEGLFFPAGQAWVEAWSVDSTIELYGSDGFHPSVQGTYLAALTMFEQISGLSPHSLPNYIPATNGDIGLSVEVATILKDAAARANQKFALTYPTLNSKQLRKK